MIVYNWRMRKIVIFMVALSILSLPSNQSSAVEVMDDCESNEVGQRTYQETMDIEDGTDLQVLTCVKKKRIYQWRIVKDLKKVQVVPRNAKASIGDGILRIELDRADWAQFISKNQQPTLDGRFEWELPVGTGGMTGTGLGVYKIYLDPTENVIEYDFSDTIELMNGAATNFKLYIRYVNSKGDGKEVSVNVTVN